MSDYRRAADLVLAALDVPAADRAALLDRECAGDAALRGEVESLLLAHNRAGDFLESPPDAADLIAAPLTVGDRIGPYRITGLIGEGGMGIVYRAEDTRLGREVALKSIAPLFTGNDQWRERLRREARAAAALTHPGVATVYALEEFDGRLFLATELVAGETLRDTLARGPLTETDVHSIGHQLAGALAVAHDRGIVHRDIKPENVMRTTDGVVKILDFGLAHLDAPADVDGPQVSQAGAIFGTPAYMSPEQLRGEPATAATDIFAVGVMLAELATGRHPFAAAHPSATAARALSSAPELRGVPSSLVPIIRTCLAKSPHDRYRSAHELRAALDGRDITATRTDDGHAFWWWQFHQISASAFALVLASALWLLRDQIPSVTGVAGGALVLVAVVAALAATTLRLHLWFTARVYPADLVAHHRRVVPITRAADLIQAASVATASARLPEAFAMATALFIASAVVLTLLSLVVEPATARAAKLR